MHRMRAARAAAIAVFWAVASPAAPSEVVAYDTALPFDDVVFGLENAIVGQGLEVMRKSHVSASRAIHEGSETLGDIYRHAESYSFCSSILSQKMMEADPQNIAFCPYTIFVYVLEQAPGVTTIGYRSMPDGAMKEAEALLDVIARNAIGHGG